VSRITTPTVTVRETTLFDAVCVALESGEFEQIRGQIRDEGNGRCAYGVALSVLERADAWTYEEVHPLFVRIDRRAGELLGCDGLAAANDAGHSFTLLAAALRRARSDIEAERNGES
jgi:hypothetical protein